MTNQTATQLAPRASHSADSRNPHRAGNTQDPVQITLATRLDAAGLTAREIADYLGHERISMTQDVYMTRKANGTNAAAALRALGPDEIRG